MKFVRCEIDLCFIAVGAFNEIRLNLDEVKLTYVFDG